LKQFNIGDVVANLETKWIGNVLDVFDRGDVRTDADGVVFGGVLELYEPERHKGYHIAPSIRSLIETKGEKI